ncbi:MULTISPECIES: hypothetical protein [Okeania]|uniref:hypothetical protein n=1 Tax=Okeania TaxID=1458928 RepID=UPI000F53AA16|nr:MULTISPECIES: hypothetical protein [Okeania]NET17929.1 hypothetical protein [Okeania sp. SIO1H5]NET77373.1 hypothetical protein [Okeania sp. SIO1F9]NET92789.1 hypothetical protein [Okeania sp. SIO1H2]
MVTVKDSSRRKKESGRRDLGLTLLEKFHGGSQRPTYYLSYNPKQLSTACRLSDIIPFIGKDKSREV